MTEQRAKALAEDLMRDLPAVRPAVAEAREAGMSWNEIAQRVAHAVERDRREVQA